MKVTIELENEDAMFLRYEVLDQISKMIDNARYWKEIDRDEMYKEFMKYARYYRRIVKAIDNRT